MKSAISPRRAHSMAACRALPCAKRSTMWRQPALGARAKLRNWRGHARSSPAGRRTFRRLIALALAGGIAGCGDLDPEQLRICERLIPAIEPDGVRVEVVRRPSPTAAANTLRIEYRTNGAVEFPDSSWISCSFGGQRLRA